MQQGGSLQPAALERFVALPRRLPHIGALQAPDGLCQPTARSAIALQIEFLTDCHYIGGMLWRNSRGRPLNAPAAFIHPCQPTVAKEPPSGPGWAHELRHNGYGLQIHVRDGRVRLFTMNGND